MQDIEKVGLTQANKAPIPLFSVFSRKNTIRKATGGFSTLRSWRDPSNKDSRLEKCQPKKGQADCFGENATQRFDETRRLFAKLQIYCKQLVNGMCLSFFTSTNAGQNLRENLVIAPNRSTKQCKSCNFSHREK